MLVLTERGTTSMHQVLQLDNHQIIVEDALVQHC